MTNILFLLSAAAIGTAAFLWFVALERSGRRIVPVLVILGLTVVEAVIYPDASLVPAGFFHPGIGGASDTSTEFGLSFRLPDILVPVALLARWLGRGPSVRLPFAAVLWLAFCGWIVTGFVLGQQRGHAMGTIVYEAKVVVYIAFFLLVAGVSSEEFASGRAFRRFLIGCSWLAVASIALDASRVSITWGGLPLFRLSEVGPLGGDAATIFLILGLFALMLGLCSDSGRGVMVAASAPLIIASVFADQRAALLAMSSSIIFLGVMVVFGRTRVKATLAEFTLGTLILVGVLVIPAAATSLSNRPNPVTPVVREVSSSFTSRGKQLSAEDRRNQWERAKELIREGPLFGSGLGTTYVHFDPGKQAFIETNITHNIGLDLLLRTGIVGFALFFSAVFSTLANGLRVWFRDYDTRVAAISVAASGALFALVTKGMVESIFEKFRLATLLGFVVGVSMSVVLGQQVARASASEAPESEAPEFGQERLGWS